MGYEGADPEGLVRRRRVGYGYPSPLRRGPGPSTEKRISHLKWCSSESWAIFFCPCTGWKNAVFLSWSSYMVYVEDEQSIAITASLGSALYWCLKFWNMTKSREQFALAFPPQQILGTHPPFPGDLLPCSKCSYFVTYAVQHGKQYHWTAGKKTDLSSEYNSEKKRVKLKWENG